MIKFTKIFLLVLVSVFLASCSGSSIVNVPVYEYPPDWKDLSKRDSIINFYSQYLSGKKIFLDPGHGGEDRRNKNLTGEIIEADVNLRVSLNLKKYLEQAGVHVLISRDKDTTVALGYRSELANKSGAELFISIHHNAPGKQEDDYTNYTSTYYHAKDTDYEFEPCERDMARYIQRDISYVMRNSGGLGSFDGTYSDYIIYPGEGFSVLRKTVIPSVLIEGAFHTSRFEAFRLNKDEFNQIQAWGIFRGLGKYFRAGIPQISIIRDSLKYENQIIKFSFNLKDSYGIDHHSIRVSFNKEEIDFSFDKVNSILSFNSPLKIDGDNIFRIVCANKNGNHARPFNRKINIVNGNEIIISE